MIEITIFKIIGGARVIQFTDTAMSEKHAVTVAQSLYNSMGLIGRYYCETSSGKCFSI